MFLFCAKIQATRIREGLLISTLSIIYDGDFGAELVSSYVSTRLWNSFKFVFGF